MHPTDAIACWRNRQAELEFHIRRHEWFLDKSVVPDPEALRHKIDGYRTEWSSYERMIRKASASYPARANTRSAA